MAIYDRSCLFLSFFLGRIPLWGVLVYAGCSGMFGIEILKVCSLLSGYGCLHRLRAFSLAAFFGTLSLAGLNNSNLLRLKFIIRCLNNLDRPMNQIPSPTNNPAIMPLLKLSNELLIEVCRSMESAGDLAAFSGSCTRIGPLAQSVLFTSIELQYPTQLWLLLRSISENLQTRRICQEIHRHFN
jgi:hypothetical protein